jgi:hypothetical protein
VGVGYRTEIRQSVQGKPGTEWGAISERLALAGGLDLLAYYLLSYLATD